MGAGLCLAHGVTSFLSNIANKYTVSVLKAYIPITNFLLQCLIVTSIGLLFRVKLKGNQWCLLSISAVYMADKVLNVTALHYISLSMFVTLRKLTTLFLFLFQLYKGHKPGLLIYVGVFLITLGAFVAGSFDLHVSLYSICLVFLQNICTAARYELAHSISHDTSSPLLLTVHMHYISLPVALLATLYLEQPTGVNIDGLKGNAVSAVMSILSMSVINLLAAHTSPLATSVTGNIKVESR